MVAYIAETKHSGGIFQVVLLVLTNQSTFSP